MPPTRRAMLGLAAALAGASVTACAPSPVVTGGPSEPMSPVPTEPEQGRAAARGADWCNRLLALVGQAPETDGEWALAVAAQTQEHLSRLNALDPLVADTEPVFTPSTVPSPRPTSFDDELAGHVTEGVALFSSLLAEAPTQPERLLQASLAAATAGLPAKAYPPVRGDASPIRFPETTTERSLGVALTHVWALINGLEVSIGRLSAGENRERAGGRLDEARLLRNRLRAAITGEPPAQEISYELPNPMSTNQEVRAGLAVLELGVLDALARLVASEADAEDWLDPLLDQVGHVQGWGGRLPYWPGWAGLE
ncbi:ferritin-like domain-containing protein [Tessaracoccus sp. OS52]|uniref:ferritin-like domain-containing protein n=1 Tax=Tessaracoccus sp. OS52 TaxID=2886691 RepID=UPI001D112AF2|nr:ferritin-like domain-containing protein [Tessaracoccus sp. OS52]MCC2593293.1 ferritin-like domain-containing protein [Tessaracoccus sp. OS52]